jgi:hypothetical protein
MADDDLPDENVDDETEEFDTDDDLDEDVLDADDDLDDAGDVDEVVAVVDEGEDEEEEEEAPAPAKARGRDEEDDDDDDVDPDDVEEDLDTILRDRIAAGAEDDEEEEEDVVVDTADGSDRVPPRAAEEHSCPECFLLVRRSQFSAKRSDCPGGLDGEDCPMKQQFV